MLHQISWFTYAVSIFSVIIIYYLYVVLKFYRADIKRAIYIFSGKTPAVKLSGAGDLQIPDYEIMGMAQPEQVEFLAPEELHFGPPDTDDETESIPALASANNTTDTRFIGEFSEMVSEVKTLIRVINESSESKENFEMLFRLIIQKYAALADTGYRQQINDYLLTEGVPQFPFMLTAGELDNYWID
jgi:hypothetical protein